MHQDETAAGDYIKGARSEDSALMMINIEGQTKFYPGYPLIMRGIYYGSRMISSQYGTVFKDSHYEKIEKYTASGYVPTHPNIERTV